MRAISILLAFLTFSSGTASAQAPGTGAARPAPAILSASALQADVQVLRQAYEALHPGLYRYNTPAAMNLHFDSLAAALGHDQSLAQAYVTIARFLNLIECGHTFPNPYNQKDRVLGEVVTAGGRVPFYFRWLDGRMIVTRNVSS